MKLLTIGYSGEQNARRVLIPIGPYQAMWPDATPQLVVVRPVDEVEYIAVTTVEEDNLVWVPSAVDCQYVGVGKCQVVFTDAENNVIGKSEIFVVQVNAAVGDGSETPPEPYEPWVNSILAAADITVENAAKTTADAADAERYAGAASDSATAAEQAKRAIEDMDVAGNTLEPDSPVTITKIVDPETGAITLTFGIPQGEKGDPGPGITFHICTSEEYDPVTRIPTVANPEPNTFYLVPAEEPVSPDLFVEWIYTNNAWEQFGSASIDLSGYATVADTVLTTTLSRGRKAGTTVGTGSFAFGSNVEASGYYSFAIGNQTRATSSQTFAEGTSTVATEPCAHAEGVGTIASSGISHVFGTANVADSVNSLPGWEANKLYHVGDIVKRTIVGTVYGFRCTKEHSSASFSLLNGWEMTNQGTYAEIVGNGVDDDNRSNAYALDWSGNGHFMGNVYVGANADSSGGTRLPHDIQVNGTSVVSNGVANVPIAGAGTWGVTQPQTDRGIGTTNGKISISPATDTHIKEGNKKYYPVCTDKQHASTFYGLAKAAGADMKDIASTTVGIYPEAQKSAISQMLNAPVTVSGSTPTIAALPGISYECGEVVTLDITLPSSGCIDVIFESGSTPTVLTITPPTGYTVEWTDGFDATSLEANTMYEVNIKMTGTKCLGVAGAWATT